MKKITKLVAFGALALPMLGNAQVSTAVQKKKALLEEYTGNFCTYCPQGHTIAQGLVDNYDAVTIKIQTGGFSGTDPVFGGTLQTPTGNSIAAPFDSQGYPNGTVSRRTAYAGIGRGDWESAVQTIITEDAPVNLDIVSTVDVTSRTLNVDVEYYYTATEANATNYLHVGYYQDNIAAYQYDPGFNPDGFYLLNEAVYEFDHAFRDMVNGTWGEVINGTTATSTGTKSYSITLPASFSTFALEPGAIKVYAYMTTTDQGEVLNVEGATPTYSNFPNNDEIGLIYVSSPTDESCEGTTADYAPKALVATYGGDDLTSFTTDVTINGTPGVYNWSGNKKHNEKFVIDVTAISFDYAATNTASLEISSPNSSTDPTAGDNTANSSFNAGGSGNASTITISATVDQWADTESTWELYDGSGDLVAESGALTKSTTNVSDAITIANYNDCYFLKLIDTYGDGWGSGSEAVIKNEAGSTIHTIDAGSFAYDVTGAARIMNDALSVSELSASNFNLYPNPTNGNANLEFNVNSSSKVVIEVINTLGQVVITNNLGTVTGAQKVNLESANLENGFYIVNVKVGNNTITQKLTVSK